LTYVDCLYVPFIAGAAYTTVWQVDENLPATLTNFNHQLLSAMISE
jgi:hypothetical protein